MSKISNNGLKKALGICAKNQKSLFLNISQSVNYVFLLLKAIKPYNILAQSISGTNNNSCTTAIMADPPFG